MPGRARLDHRLLLTAGGLLIGAGLFLGGYASLGNPWVSVLTAIFLLTGVLFSEALSSDRPAFYVIAAALLAIAAGCSLLLSDPAVVPAGACSFLGPILVARGLGTRRSSSSAPSGPEAGPVGS